jgi:hypothetical protein
VPNQPKTPNRNVRVPDDLWQALTAVAAERECSVSDVIRDELRRVMLTHPYGSCNAAHDL